MDKLIGIRAKLADMSGAELALFQANLADAYSDHWRKVFVDAMFQLLLNEYRNDEDQHHTVMTSTINAIIESKQNQATSIPPPSPPTSVSDSDSESRDDALCHSLSSSGMVDHLRVVAGSCS